MCQTRAKRAMRHGYTTVDRFLEMEHLWDKWDIGTPAIAS
jgi:hypothetical protein